MLREIKNRARKDDATIYWGSGVNDLSKVFNSQTDERWASALAPVMQGVVVEAAQHWTVETGISFDVRNLQAEDWFNKTALQFSTPINATSERELAAILQQADRDGWTVSTTQKALSDTFNQWINGNTDAASFAAERLPPYRTEMIARTVSTQSYSAGSMELYKSEGVQQKEWLATMDNRTRDDHAEANGQVVGVDEPFLVGGYEMMFPGDDSGGADASEIVNCRCTVLPVLDEGLASGESE